MKTILVKFGIALFPFASITAFSASEQLSTQAKNWVYTHIIHNDGTPRIETSDIQAVANLIYLSWARSTITIKCQSEMLSIINDMWKGWQNVTQTRLDPSIDQPYAIPLEKQKSTTSFWNLAKRHRSIGTIYTYAVKMILEKQLVQSSTILDGIADLRDKARKLVVSSLLDIRKQLGNFFNINNSGKYYEKKQIECKYNDAPYDDNTNKSIKFFEFISTYIPQLALNSFIEANKLQNIASEEGWHTLKAIQEVGNYTWKIIEETRAEFYAAYYTALFEALGTEILHGNYLKLMFNEHGVIQKDQQEILLPTPYKLSLSIL